MNVASWLKYLNHWQQLTFQLTTLVPSSLTMPWWERGALFINFILIKCESCCQRGLNVSVFSRFLKKTSKVWSALWGQRARRSEGSREGEKKKKNDENNHFQSHFVYHVQKVPRALLADYRGWALKGRDLKHKAWVAYGAVWQCVRDTFVTRPFSFPSPLLPSSALDGLHCLLW